VYFSQASAIFLSLSSSRASMNLSAFAMPARLATSETVIALSPEMTLTATPCFSK